MSFASHYHELLRKLRILALLLACAALATFAYLYARLPVVPDEVAPDSVSLSEWAELPDVKDVDWSRFHAINGSQLGQPGFADGFRFAGTFFLSNNGSEDIRKAVVGIVDQNRQIIVSEGDRIEDVVVERILRDRLLLRKGLEKAELRLSFAAIGKPKPEDESDSEGEAEEVTRFGKRVGDDNWVLERNELVSYYQELLDNPERLVKVFDSLKPIYTDEGRIEGYRLGVEGEREFFDGVGFKEGDVVRKVNSLDMTSRHRAEYFIRQVVNSRLSAIVIDVEREDAPRRLVYQVR